MPAPSPHNDFYVYEHLRADTGEVFYVGKGRGYRAHVFNRHHRSEWWQRTREKAGGFEVRFVNDGMTEAEAFDLEVRHIAILRQRGAALCNMTDGGDGISGCERTPEWRAKIGAAHRGKVVSEEARRNISESRRAVGCTLTEEGRKRISATHRGQRRALGYRHTEEWKAAQSAARIGNNSRLGQTRSPEERAKASAALAGRVQGILTCPHCGKSGGNVMRRHHFDNCKSVRDVA